MFGVRTDFSVDSACWMLAGGILPATCSLLLLTSSASGLVDCNNSHHDIPLEICDSKLRALVAAQSARETERTAPRSLRAHRSMRTAHHSARTAPRAPLRAHSSARTAPLAQLRSRLLQCSVRPLVCWRQVRDSTYLPLP